MNKKKMKALADGALCSLLSLVLVLIGLFVPSVLFLMMILAGIPMMYLGMRRGLRILSLSGIMAVLLLTVITNSLYSAILTGMMSFLPGMVLGYTLRTHKTFPAIIFSGAAVLVLGLGLQVGILNAIGGGHGVAELVNQSLEELHQNMKMVFSSLEGQLPMKEQDLMNVLNQTIDMTRDIIFLYLPSFLIGSAVVTSYLIFMLGTFVLHRTRPVRIIYQPFWGIFAPKTMCYVFGILYLITASSESTTIWMAALRNVQVLLVAYFAVCGMSLVDYKLHKKIASGYARTFVYCGVLCVGYFFVGMLFQILCILGIVDGFLGIRIREERIGNE